MRISHSLLLASVAILTLPSCSAAQGPGEIGSKEDIVVRNHGDAPAPPSTLELSDTEMQGDVPPEPELTDPSVVIEPTPGDAASMAEAQAEAPAPELAPGIEVDSSISAAPEAAPVETAAETPIETPEVNEPVQEDVRPEATAAGMTPVMSPEVEAGGEVRPAAQADQPGETLEEVASPQVEQAAGEFQNQDTKAAAAEALKNPPKSVEAGAAPAPAPAPAAVPRAPTAAPVAAAAAPTPAPAATSYPPRASRFVPSAEAIAHGGARIVTTSDGQVLEKPFDGSASAAVPMAPVAPPAPATTGSNTAPVPLAAPAPAAPSAGMPAVPAAPVASPQITSLSMSDPAFVHAVQKALFEKGFYKGAIDGKNSTELLNALSQYQSANALVPGPMDEQTARHLGLFR